MMLAIKYREVNAKGEMSGGPMYTMKKGLKNKTFGAILAWLFAPFCCYRLLWYRKHDTGQLHCQRTSLHI